MAYNFKLYQLEPEDEKFLDAIKNELTDSSGEKFRTPEMEMKFNLLKRAMQSSGTRKGRNYAVATFLNRDPLFTNAENYPESIRDAWSQKHIDDYTPPNIATARAKKDAEEFWKWDENGPGERSWKNRSKEELERIAKDAGYSDLSKFMDDVRDEQTRLNRERDFEKEFGKLGSFAVKTLYPRMSEAVLRGDDIGGKDVALDMVEQGLYAGLNPAERLLGGAAKGSNIASKAAKAGSYFANPLTMEVADAIAYRDNENTDRNYFSPVDVTIGAGMNKIIGGTMFKNMERPTNVKGPFETKNWAKNVEKAKWSQQQAEGLFNVGRYNEGFKKLDESSKYFDKAIKENPVLEKKLTGERIKQSFTAPALRENAAQNVKNDVVGFGENKLGDILSENPKTTRRALNTITPARLLGGVETVYGGLDAAADFFGRKKKPTEKEEINRKIEMLYGLDDWRE